jgi:hypothetical protein
MKEASFLIALANLFNGRIEIAAGELHRALRQLQRGHFDPRG